MRVHGAAALLTAVATLGWVAATAPTAAQGLVERERPVIGLVLSGGGARGGAHLGVIKALEELNVPIDLVAGTSIGAAIGGLYASGMTVEELEEFVETIDWEAAFLNATPRELHSFRRKREDELFFLETRPGLDDEGFALPVGVVQGQVIDTIMARVTLPVLTVDDFDELALPFRAVAGDLETGDAVILGQGNLGRAIRASMTVPAALAPIEINGRLLVDGGIVMNLPVEVAEAMGAERLIAVDISERLQPRDEIRSVVDVTEQLTGMLTVGGTSEQIERLGEDDVLIRPEFGEDYSSVTFTRMAETIDAGYQSVMERREDFEPYALSEAEYAAYRAARRNPRAPELPVIDFIRLGDTAPLAESVIRARVADVLVGDRLDLDALERSLNRIYGLDLYQNVRYELVRDGDRQGLDVDLIERSWGPSYVELGLRYSSASDEDARFGIAASYLRTGINSLGGEWRATFVLGDEPGFNADWYQPLGSKALNFVNPGLTTGSSIKNIFDQSARIAEIKERSAVLEFGGGREFLDFGEIRGGFRVGAGDTELRVGDPAAVPYRSFHLGEIYSRFTVDTLDNISFPRQGTHAVVEWRGSNESVLDADDAYDQLSVRASRAKTWGRHTLVGNLRYDATISGESPPYAAFEFGGFRDLSGFNIDEFTGQYVTRVGLSYYRRIGDLALFPAFAGFSAEFGNVWQSRDEISANASIWGASLWAGVDTPAGPVFLGYGSTENGEDAFYVFLGRLF